MTKFKFISAEIDTTSDEDLLNCVHRYLVTYKDQSFITILNVCAFSKKIIHNNLNLCEDLNILAERARKEVKQDYFLNSNKLNKYERAVLHFDLIDLINEIKTEEADEFITYLEDLKMSA